VEKRRARGAGLPLALSGEGEIRVVRRSLVRGHALALTEREKRARLLFLAHRRKEGRPPGFALGATPARQPGCNAHPCMRAVGAPGEGLLQPADSSLQNLTIPANSLPRQATGFLAANNLLRTAAHPFRVSPESGEA
jgi:hypothetical protein